MSVQGIMKVAEIVRDMKVAEKELEEMHNKEPNNPGARQDFEFRTVINNARRAIENDLGKLTVGKT